MHDGNANRQKRHLEIKFTLSDLICGYSNAFNSSNVNELVELLLVVTTFKARKRKKNSPSCAHVLRKTLNLVISRRCLAEEVKEKGFF